MSSDERLENARLLYERALFGGDASALDTADRELNAVEADLSLARGRILHARFFETQKDDPDELRLFHHAADLYQSLGDVRGEAEALFWIGIYHQAVRNDDTTAVPALERSLTLAKAANADLTTSYALRHLGIAAHKTGDLKTARTHLEESTRLRRRLNFLPGTAANLVGLAYILKGN
ncbi:hypothetical protein AB0M95_15165 [Sphaerisporangium sp. NPDC051017]|uniref:hypothetical protein n=1 Tax=Sphaerisporangium sp. NPDC051017 TaxID=3154636 RepID=UPI00342F8EAB